MSQAAARGVGSAAASRVRRASQLGVYALRFWRYAYQVTGGWALWAPGY